MTRFPCCRTLMSLPLGCALLLVGCATPGDPDTVKLRITPEAARIIDEKGAAIGAEAGSRESRQASTDVICETVQRTGSHMTTRYCYGRAEQQRTRDKLKSEWQRITDGGVRAGDN